MDGRERVSSYWGDQSCTDQLARLHWMGSPVVRAHLNQLVSGRPDRDWLTWGWHRWVLSRAPRRGALRVLVLGCGTGWLERALSRLPRVDSIDACDVSEGAVAEARKAAAEAGLGERIRYHVVDLNVEPPPGGPYEAVIAHSVLHHVENLELAYRGLEEALVSGGLLLFNEYVGPRRFQFTTEQMAVINGVLARLPARLRTSATMGIPYPHKEVPDEGQLIAVDPSEAVRSDELMAFTRRQFEVLEEVAYGGTVLQHLLYDIVPSFDPASWSESRLLALICFLEATLIREGELPADYTVLLARRRVGSERPGGVRPRRVGRRPEPRPVRVAEVVGGTGDPPLRPRISIHSRPARGRRHGLDLDPVTAHLHRLATGDPACDWLTWVLSEVVAGDRPGRALVVEEPPAWLEPAVGTVKPVEAVDVLVPSIGEDDAVLGVLRPAGGEARTGAMPLADLVLPAGAYRWIFSNGWLGRAPDRPRLVRRLVAALAPGGRLIGDEWTGRPDRRTSRATLRYARRLIELLQPPGAPPSSRRERLRGWLADLWNGAPSLFRSPAPELGRLLGTELQVEVERPTGGALLQRVLATGAEELDGTCDADLAFASVLSYLEEQLTEPGVVESEYTCFVARRRD